MEALIATAIVIVIGWAGLSACKMIAQATLWSNSAQRGERALETQATLWQSDAASALAVFVPATDMNGRLNAGQELDFFSKTSDGHVLLWRYYYDAAARTVQRWDYDPSGMRGTRDGTSGAIDAATAYPRLEDVTHFAATAIAADELGNPVRNVYSGIASMFLRAPQAWPVDLNPAGANSPAAVAETASFKCRL